MYMMYGEDRHQMKYPMKIGGAVADRGGVWVPIIYPDMTRFSGSHYQMPQMRLYATIYGSYFTTMDGTHNTKKYRFTNAPWVTKCCLGLSRVIGMGLFLSDNLADIIESDQLFGVAAAFANDNSSSDEDENSSSDEVSIVMLFSKIYSTYVQIIIVLVIYDQIDS